MKLDGKKIKALRQKAGLSQFKLSLETDLSRAMIDRIENGHCKKTSIDTVCKLMGFFKVPFEELIIN